MARTVFCEYLKKDAEGLDFQLYPGELSMGRMDQKTNHVSEREKT